MRSNALALTVTVALTAMLALAPAAGASEGVVGSFGSVLPGVGVGELNTPDGVAVNDATGDVYVADSANDRIEQFSATGTFIRTWGGQGSGAGKLSDPQGVAVDQSTGDVYVSDAGNLRVDEFSEQGGFLRAFGAGVVASGPDQVPVNAQQSVSVTASGGTFTLTFQSQTTAPIAFDAQAKGEDSVQRALESLAGIGAGNVSVIGQAGGPYTVTFVGALADEDVAQLSANGAGLTGAGAGVSVSTLTIGAGAAEVCSEGDTCQAGVSTPTGGGFASSFDGYLAVAPAGAPDAGDVIVADPANSRIQEFTATGEFVLAYGRNVNHTATKEAASQAERDLCMAVSGDLCQAGEAGDLVGQFAAGEPTRVAVDAEGAIYTVEAQANFRVQKLTPADGGLSASVFAEAILSGTEAGNAPTDVAVDPTSGDVYVVRAYPAQTGPYDPPERLVLRLSPSGTLEEQDMAGDGIDSVNGLALGSQSGRVYVSSMTSGQRVYILEAVPAPTGPPYAPCPNEALRELNSSTGLPDCRAYEQVTPSYQDGFGVNEVKSISEDGSQVIDTSLGSFAGAEANPHGVEGGYYQFTRTVSGWAASALSPPASAGWINEEYVASAPDGSTLWQLLPASETHSGPLQRDLYIRAAGGALTQVGPLLPFGSMDISGSAHPSIVGESRDLSHVFFSSISGEDELWPFDATSAGHGLYEYSGTGNSEPELVGVSGGLGSKTLISQCGTKLAGSDNAISASGETVFFIAEYNSSENPPCAGKHPPVSELYARISREKTLAISEEPVLPAGEICTGVCEEYRREAGGHHRSAAVFQGASEDGSKVFFTTQQPLLNSDEDTANDLYMAEIEGEGESAAVSKLIEVSHDPTKGQAAEVQGVVSVSEDGSRVYFVAKGVLSGEPNALGQRAQPSEDNLYVYDTETQRTVFVTRLSSFDSGVWTSKEGVQATSNGGFLVFESVADLTGEVSGEDHEQLYRYDASTGGLLRVSIGQDGYNANGANGNMAIPRDRTLSEDGSYVFFQSSDGLTPGALNERVIDPEGHKANNVYEWEADHVGGCELYTGCVWLISDGSDVSETEGSRVVELLGTDASGEDVFFTTSDALSPTDTDNGEDIYDARAGGGFPAPSEPASCAGDLCQSGESPAGSALPAPATASFAGSGDLVSALTTIVAPASKPVVRPKRKTAAQVRAQALAKALRACRSKAKSARKRCEVAARKRYASKAKAKTKAKGSSERGAGR